MDIMKVKDEQGNWVTVPAFQGQLGKTPSFSIGRVDLGTTPSSAAATITGTDEAPVLNLVLPKGIDGEDGVDGFSPTVSVSTITGGHRVSVTDTDGTETFDVMDGVDGQDGATGPAGPGVPTGGTAGQYLVKQSGTDYDADWEDVASSTVIATITIPLSWTDSGSGYYTAIPTINAVFTSDSKIDLQPGMATIAQLRDDGVEALYIENNSMALTAYAVGNAPNTALTMQCTVTESEAATPPTPTPIDPTIDAFYPVGSIYLAATSLDPNIVFGGTWVRIKDTFLLASGDTYAGGTTGGEAEHTLTVSEMPDHTHKYGQYKGAAGWSGTSPQRNFLKTTGDDGYSDTDSSGYMTTMGTGGGAAHNNMPPYLAIWAWKRTA